MRLNELSAWQFEGSFEEFYKKALQKNDIFKQTHKQPKQSFIIKDGFRILSDTITHTVIGHALTPEQWDVVIKLLNDKNIIRQEESLSPRFNGNPIIYSLTDGTNLYGICVEYFKNKLPYITTAFIGTEKEIEQWFKRNEEHTLKIKKGNRQGEAKTSVTTEGLLLGRVSNNSITENAKNVKTLNDNFYKWFGKSKIVNPDGTPKIVSHRTNKTFDSFDKNKISSSNLNGKGFYFSGSDDKGKKNSYGKNIGYYYLRMENPVRKSDWIDRATLEKYFDTNVVAYIFNNVQSSAARQGDKVKWVMVFFNLWNYKMNFGKDLHVTEVLKKMGYDGIIDDEIEDTFVVFEPNQIKSVENKGTWSDSENVYETLNREIERYL